MMRLLDECEENKPDWIMCENVKNLLSIDNGIGFLEVVGEMAERGYTVEWKVYNSKDYGVPQNRERVYIVGHHGESAGQPLLPVRRESTAALRQVVGGSQGERVYDGNKISCTLSSQGGGCGAKTGLYTFVDLNKKGSVQTTDTARALLARYNKGQPNRPAECSGVLARITPNDSHVKVMPILTPDRLEKRQNGRRTKNEGEPSFTLTSQDRHGVLIVDGHIKIRKLTPRECFRLQGFTDEQFDRAAAVNSETQLYKQAGNAVTVNVVEEIGRHIAEVTMARRNKRRHYQAPRIVILGKTAEKNNKLRKSVSRCAFCGRPLFRESAWHWIYDEFGQRVKKCNNESICRECRSQEGEDAYITAVTGRRPRHEEQEEE